jgi:polyisoprenoid-binding protein YceI
VKPIPATGRTTINTELEETTMTTWQIDGAHTSVEFAVKHLMIATVRGRFGKVSGTVVTPAGSPAHSTVSVAIEVDSIDTREAQRDAHLRSADFFDAEKFPKITFVGRRTTGDLEGSFRLIGDLTIRGTTREVILEVTSEGRAKDSRGNQRAGYSARTTILRKDFGLTWNQLLEAGGVAVGDEVRISLDLELVQQVEEPAGAGLATAAA